METDAVDRVAIERDFLRRVNDYLLRAIESVPKAVATMTPSTDQPESIQLLEYKLLLGNTLSLLEDLAKESRVKLNPIADARKAHQAIKSLPSQAWPRALTEEAATQTPTPGQGSAGGGKGGERTE